VPKTTVRQALLIIDVQPSFNPPDWLIEGINRLIGTMPSVATVERHNEAVTPFQRQLGWTPGPTTIASSRPTRST